MFKHLVASAAIAGIIAGVLLTAIQQIEIAPLIRAAEAIEAVQAAPAQPGNDDATSWSPRPGWQRPGATAAANVVLATGFALLLGAAISLRRQSGWRAGLLWGIAGYAVFFVAPAIGLPPELPGGAAAPLGARQMWWVGTVSASAAGGWLAAFARPPLLRATGFALIAAPHLIGAPSSPGNDSADALAFVRATYLANAALWATLGVLIGALASPGRSGGVADRGVAPRAREAGILPPR